MALRRLKVQKEERRNDLTRGRVGGVSVGFRTLAYVITYNLESLDVRLIVVKRLAIGPLGRAL